MNKRNNEILEELSKLKKEYKNLNLENSYIFEEVKKFDIEKYETFEDKEKFIKELEKLEEKYKDYQLLIYNKDDENFNNSEIYGEIFEQQFYWRILYNSTALIIGPYSPETDRMNNENIREKRDERYKNHLENNECIGENCFPCFSYKNTKFSNQDPLKYKPPIILLESRIDKLKIVESFYLDDKGLNFYEVENVFEILLKTLKNTYRINENVLK